MKKRKRIFKGVAFLFIIMTLAFLGLNVEAAKTTDGSSCGKENEKELETFYSVRASFESSSNEIVIKVSRGAFKVSDILEGGNLLMSDPRNMGTITAKTPLRIRVNTDLVKSNFEKVKLQLILAETDSKCMSKADYDLAVKEKRKGGTYVTGITTNIPNFKTMYSHDVPNSNIDGICKVLMQGVEYDKYKDKLSITAEDIANYNYRVVGEDGQAFYGGAVNYCMQKTVPYNYTSEQVGSMISSAMSSWKNRIINEGGGSTNPDTADFTKSFNEARDKAMQISGHHFENYNGKDKLESGVLRCNWKNYEVTKDTYYVNTDYYYAKQEENISAVYTYNYTGGAKDVVKGPVCTRTCEEAVVVEYGPPVASKAGLCFEYKIRVTSRVKCESQIKGGPPEEKRPCTPIPICNSIPGYTHQAGPKEEFDACIQSCDGGKYTQKCSNYCYKQIYGKTASTKLALNYQDIAVKKIADFSQCSGRYDRLGGSIVWKGNNTYGRWYCEQDYPMVEKGYHLERGFKWGDHCNDDCQWVGCDGKTYLNSEDATKDNVANLAAYHKAVEKCTASASCSTKTAEFEISVTYKHKPDKDQVLDNNNKADGKGNIDTTINFPYTENNAKNKATLPSLGRTDAENDNTNASPSNTQIFIPDTNPKGYAGCYDKASARNWYQAEWSFPGTSIHNKTGDISYIDKSGDNAWHYKKNKFCVPLNALSVNTKWWEWSQIKKGCITDSDVGNSINYNINAETRDFGYFGWKFTFSCFYALKNEICDTSVNGCCNPDPDGSGGGTTIGPKNFTFRIVDTMDLFPATNGSSIDTSRDKTTTVTGRKPGFNWTLDATNIKNEQYKVEPLALIGKVQDRKGIIYDSNEYLDYSFILTKEKLNEIRQYNKGKQYNAYNDGDTEVKNGITVYTSKLITKYVDGNHRGNIGCNNDGIGSACE